MPADESQPAKKRRVSDRTSQACLKCRAQKMKCIGGGDPPCRRCRITASLCEFIPRANAALQTSPAPYPSHTCSDLWRQEVNSRIRDLEDSNLRLQRALSSIQASNGRLPASLPADSLVLADNLDVSPLQSQEDHSGNQIITSAPDYSAVLSAVDALKEELPAAMVHDPAWDPDTIGTLWSSFRTHMPGLHFFSGQVSFTHPTPLLAVSILYVAAAHYPSADYAAGQTVYLKAFARAVGALSIPELNRGSALHSSPQRQIEDVNDKFDDVLGIILVGLLAIGWVDTVGMWVNVAYRLLLDGMAIERGERLEEWKGLWEGLRTIELEHSSLHLICPALPAVLPGYALPTHEDSRGPAINAATVIGELLQLMQARMSRFAGRGLPTVWNTVCSSPAEIMNGNDKAEKEDIEAIHTWAQEVDQWYGKHASRTANSSTYVRTIILLNYHLHKLFVLSIFLPLQGVNLVSSRDREALLCSSRLVLQIEGAGFEIWSSWDLVMLTHASLILLSAIVAGTSSHEDSKLVNHHLCVLRSTHQTAPNLRHTLSERLEKALQTVRSPTSRSGPMPVAPLSQCSAEAIGTTTVYSHPSTTLSLPATVNDPPVDFTLFDPLFVAQGSDWTQPNYNLAMPTNTVSLSTTGMAPPVAAGEDAEWPPFLLNMFGYDHFLPGSVSGQPL